MIGRAVALASCLLCACAGFAQTKSGDDEQQQTFTLKLPVDEVVLTFHATDTHGLPVNDLKAEEVRVFDNGAAPRRVVSFDGLMDRPIRAALLMDTSESMQRELPAGKRIAEQFTERIFRQKTDEAMVIDFAYSSDFLVPWNADKGDLTKGIEGVRFGRMNPLPGTALLDAVFRACYYGFDKMDPSTTGNFLLILSDGEDTAGHASRDEALRACQRSNTSIYAFLFPSSEGGGSTGPRMLRALADGTGGRVFAADDTPDAVAKDLEIIESEMRNQYRLVYAPADFRHDGLFHTIELQLPDRVHRVEVRRGYFAPVK